MGYQGNRDIVRNFTLIMKDGLALHHHRVSNSGELAFCGQRREWVCNSPGKRNCVLLEQLWGFLPLFAGGLAQIRNGIHACCLLSWKEGECIQIKLWNVDFVQSGFPARRAARCKWDVRMNLNRQLITF